MNGDQPEATPTRHGGTVASRARMLTGSRTPETSGSSSEPASGQPRSKLCSPQINAASAETPFGWKPDAESDDLHFRLSPLPPITPLLPFLKFHCLHFRLSPLPPITPLLPFLKFHCLHFRLSPLPPITPLLPFLKFHCFHFRLSPLPPITPLLPFLKFHCLHFRLSPLPPITPLLPFLKFHSLRCGLRTEASASLCEVLVQASRIGGQARRVTSP